MTTTLTPSLSARLTVEAFLHDYMLTIDSDRLEDWHTFFEEDGTYNVTTRENMELGLPLNLMSCEGHGMFKDRIVALRTANIFEPHVYCHIPGALRVTSINGDLVESESSFTIVRTTNGGDMDVFICGRSHDTVRLGKDGPKLKNRTVILDSRQIDTLLVIPV
jgi:3-phenylpropionate/cinnamic acid dioxygenase small subunit